MWVVTVHIFVLTPCMPPKKSHASGGTRGAATTGGRTAGRVAAAATNFGSSAAMPALPCHAQWLPPNLIAASWEMFLRYAATDGAPRLEPGQPPTLSLAATQRLLADLGMVASENDVRDMILRLAQAYETTGSVANLSLSFPLMLAVLWLPQPLASTPSALRKGNPSQGTAASTASSPADAAAAAAQGGAMEPEYRALWKALDADQDGLLGARDVAAAYQRFAHDEGLQHITAEEVQTLLHELDENNDGVVSYDDLVVALTTH
mgnify:CR=1 FL=1